MFRHQTTPILPLPARLSFRAVHSDDVARGLLTVLVDTDADGVFNLAADPVLDTRDLAAIMGPPPFRPPPARVETCAVRRMETSRSANPAGVV